MMEHRQFYPWLRLFFSLALVLGLLSVSSTANAKSYINGTTAEEEINKVKEIVMPEIQKFAIAAIGISVGVMAIKAFVK